MHVPNSHVTMHVYEAIIMYAGESDILVFLLCAKSRMLEFKILICMYIYNIYKTQTHV